MRLASPIFERILRGRNRERLLSRIRVVVEVACVGLPLDLGLEGRRDLLREQVIPTHVLEPLVVLDVIDAVLQVAVALAQIRCQQLLDQPLRILVENLREDDLPAKDRLIDAHGILVDEWRVPDDHLVYQDPKRPPIHGLPMALVQQDLGSDVLRGTAQGVRTVLHDLGEPEVCQFHIAVDVDEDVLRLQVAIDDVQFVAILEDRSDLRRIEHGHIVLEARFLPQVREELAANDVLEEHVDVPRVVKGAMHIHDEGVVHHGKYVLLAHDVVHLLHLDDGRLLERLQSIVLPGRLMRHEPYTSKGPSAKCFAQRESFNR
mmetsp:Transcript_15770/g.44916  ORF Transcript_15770/g.44916 Transcript_15770/m.44916 type:complete len:318 (-) Transcript_15770:75-1028(-)